MDSIIDLVDQIGFEAVDAEVAVWIEIGEYDEQVRERAKHLRHEDDPVLSFSEGALQKYHRYAHPNGPYGYEFCARCTSNVRSF